MKRSKFILPALLILLLAGCQSYKNVPYMQDLALRQMLESDSIKSLYDARIMPKDLLTIVVSCPEEPELATPFNLTVSTIASMSTTRLNTTTQPVLQQYLVDNDGNVDLD